MSICVFNNNIEQFMADYKGEKFHAILCDPPYHLTSIVKRFGNSTPDDVYKNAELRKNFNQGVSPFARTARGFMGKQWDGGGIAFDPRIWHMLGELLYPGGFIMAYGGTRTYHRMAVAIEDAGFIIHPAIGWVQTMGFPKATRIDLQIDKKLGLKRKRGETVKTGFASGTHRHAGTENKWGFNDEYVTTHATHPLAQTWEGHRYGLQTLKPSFEFICVAQRPYGKHPLDDIVLNGAGAINIDGARLVGRPWTWGTQTDIRGNNYNQARPSDGDVFAKNINSNPNGRWPANVVMAHLPECRMIGTEEVPYTVNQFTDGAKPFGNGAGHEYESSTVNSTREIWKCAPGCPVSVLQEQANQRGSQGDVGDVFYSPQYVEEEIEFADKYIFSSKVTPQERDAGLKHLPKRNIGVPDGEKTDNTLKGPGNSLHPDKNIKTHNIHPTLKPIMLNKWLATLLLPPPEYAPRRILVPFAGVMSEAIGCDLAGWEEVVAVELEQEYAEIGQERINYWTSIRSSGADARKLDKRQLSFDEVMLNKKE